MRLGHLFPDTKRELARFDARRPRIEALLNPPDVYSQRYVVLMHGSIERLFATFASEAFWMDEPGSIGLATMREICQ